MIEAEDVVNRERRSSNPRCLGCKQICDVVVRFEHAAPYCRACGEQISRLQGWEQLPDRRERDVGPPRVRFSPSSARVFQRPNVGR